VKSRLSKSRTLLVVAAVAITTVTVAFAAADAMRLSAKMDARQVVVPRKPVGNVADATGTFRGTVTASGSRWKLTWRIAYAKLANPVVVIADIHRGRAKQFGPILVRLCAHCYSGQNGVKRVTAETVSAMKNGNAFITLITNKNPNGEIRGQIKVR
jgi:hypothetical protein